MNSRILLLVIGLTGLSTRLTGYTAIAVGKSPNHPNAEVDGYSHLPQPRDVVEKRALENCTLAGGKDPKIVLSSGGAGYYAVAAGSVDKGHVFGWAGPLGNEKAAAAAAIANCKQRGGADPKIRAQWAEHAKGWKPS
jgi:hypothetical protein